MNDLTQMHCKACEGGVAPLAQSEAAHLLKKVPGWTLNEQGTEIQRTFSFKNYYHTMAFVNALAYISHRENHHPDLNVSYNQCVVRYTTHAIGGLSENDFICAAKAASLIEEKRN
ncbi:MAG: 4a-hydroxytetrahydrobiopterin dehydratase [Proteobacteria bacterium]|nr:4a-hydroxytetrahydrobiopterin dehydratase [Pseudomonadota bacterium]